MTVSQIWSHIMLYSLYYSYNGHLTYPHLKFWGMEDLWAHFIQHFRFFSFFDKSCMSHNKCTWSTIKQIPMIFYLSTPMHSVTPLPHRTQGGMIFIGKSFRGEGGLHFIRQNEDFQYFTRSPNEHLFLFSHFSKPDI